MRPRPELPPLPQPRFLDGFDDEGWCEWERRSTNEARAWLVDNALERMTAATAATDLQEALALTDEYVEAPELAAEDRRKARARYQELTGRPAPA